MLSPPTVSILFGVFAERLGRPQNRRGLSHCAHLLSVSSIALRLRFRASIRYNSGHSETPRRSKSLPILPGPALPRRIAKPDLKLTVANPLIDGGIPLTIVATHSACKSVQKP